MHGSTIFIDKIEVEVVNTGFSWHWIAGSRVVLQTLRVFASKNLRVFDHNTHTGFCANMEVQHAS
jgi:hypothetical protein